MVGLGGHNPNDSGGEITSVTENIQESKFGKFIVPILLKVSNSYPILVLELLSIYIIS